MGSQRKARLVEEVVDAAVAMKGLWQSSIDSEDKRWFANPWAGGDFNE